MTFADKLRELRESKGLTRESLAAMLNISPHTLIKWEQGTREPTFRTVLEICKVLEAHCSIFEGCNFGEAENKPGRGRPPKSKKRGRGRPKM